MSEALDSGAREKTTDPLPTGTIAAYSGSAAPRGWIICDGSNGTPDLRDRFIVGDTAVSVGSSVGTVSPTAALTHAGAAVGAHSDHVVTQPAAHSDHVVTQAAAHGSHAVTQAAAHGQHSNVGGHTHDAHATAAATASTNTALTGPGTHATGGAHSHDSHDAHTGGALDAHSAHSGGALDAHSAHAGFAVTSHPNHSVTQSSDHAILKHYKLAFFMWSP